MEFGSIYQISFMKKLFLFLPEVMNYFWTLMGIFLLVLNLDCCRDTPDMRLRNEPTAYSTIRSKNIHHQDNCSPLCTCNCCGCMVVIIKTFSEKLILAFTSAADPRWVIEEFPSAVCLSIWQPPRLFTSLF